MGLALIGVEEHSPSLVKDYAKGDAGRSRAEELRRR